MHVISFQLPQIENSMPEAPPSWRDSAVISALADSERHLGHIVLTDKYHAYDATHADASSTNFLYLGAFTDRESAKLAVEAATGWRMPLRARHAGSELLT